MVSLHFQRNWTKPWPRGFCEVFTSLEWQVYWLQHSIIGVILISSWKIIPLISTLRWALRDHLFLKIQIRSPMSQPAELSDTKCVAKANQHWDSPNDSDVRTLRPKHWVVQRTFKLELTPRDSVGNADWKISVCVYVHSTHPDKEGLVSQSVASLREVLDGNPVGAVAGWVVHAVLLQGITEDHKAAILLSHCKINEHFITWHLQLSTLMAWKKAIQ